VQALSALEGLDRLRRPVQLEQDVAAGVEQGGAVDVRARPSEVEQVQRAVVLAGVGSLARLGQQRRRGRLPRVRLRPDRRQLAREEACAA
jgi:hypothetical protein